MSVESLTVQSGTRISLVANKVVAAEMAPGGPTWRKVDEIETRLPLERASRFSLFCQSFSKLVVIIFISAIIPSCVAGCSRKM